MIRLITDPWVGLRDLCRAHDIHQLEILTGFIGRGATHALASLGVRARIIIGLPSGEAGLSHAQVNELAELRKSHEVRWLPGLHAKLYLLDQRIVMAGSANFTKSGFEHLDELALATDDPAVVAHAISEFETRFTQARSVDPTTLTVLPPSPTTHEGNDGETVELGLGIAWDDRTSGFSIIQSDASIASATSSDGLEGTAGTYMFANVSEGPHRCWTDCRRYGFLSAGQGPRWSRSLRRLVEGDRVYAYLEGWGFVGFGTVTGAPRMARDHVVTALGKRLFDLELAQPNIASNADDPDYCEWVVPVEWHMTFGPDSARCKEHFRRGHAVCRIGKPEALHDLAVAFSVTDPG